MERKTMIGNRVEGVRFFDLPEIVADTLAKEYELYNRMTKLDTIPEEYAGISYFIAFDTTIQGVSIKYQDFYSDKFGLPFGYFFKFGKKKFHQPYREQTLTYPYIYYDGYLYITGKYFGDECNNLFSTTRDKSGNMMRVHNYHEIEYQKYLIWKWKIKL